MGFCLFECPDPRSLYIAINAAHVDEVVTRDRDVCRIALSAGPEGERLVEVLGQEKEINQRLYEAAKIGFRKAEITILGGTEGNLRPAPMLFNAPGRVVMVRDLLPDEFLYEDAEFVTVSLMTQEDGKLRHAVDRAGLFARKANQGGRVPTLIPEA